VKRIAQAGLLLAALPLFAALDPRIVELRNRGHAELENEQPANAEALFRELTRLAPEEPLGHANLAVAALRQQEFEEALAAIDRALKLDKGSASLLAIKADVMQWSGRSEEAGELYLRAAEAAPDDVEAQYALYRFATTVAREPDPKVVDATLARLAALRPENLVVILQRGRRAVETGDRAAATAAFLRVGELLWQAPDGSERLHEAVVDALEGGDLAAARLPAQRLENVLKITAM
jgi:tetratricopeptide (TPR) repeat protein